MSKREVVEREPISVQFVAAASDEIEDIQRAWSELESIVELHGRRFYGAYYPSERSTAPVSSCARVTNLSQGSRPARCPAATTCGNG